tara:strand:+ start:1062 stop:1448 length:387 start_codon:yes stop_codon:yes gene_type:complete
MNNPKNAGMQKLTDKIMRGGASPTTQRKVTYTNVSQSGHEDPDKDHDYSVTQKDITRGVRDDRSNKSRTKRKTVEINEDSWVPDDKFQKTVNVIKHTKHGEKRKTKTKTISKKRGQRIQARHRRKAGE